MCGYRGSDKRDLLLSDSSSLRPPYLCTQQRSLSAATSAERNFTTPVAYFGTYVPTYQVMACNKCYAANGDGWAPNLEQTVTRNLKAKGLRIPERNTKGLLPREEF